MKINLKKLDTGSKVLFAILILIISLWVVLTAVMFVTSKKKVDVPETEPYVEIIDETEKINTEVIEESTEGVDSFYIEDVEETVWATLNVNIRLEPDETSEKIGLLCGGQSITRTGICENGWSRVLHNDMEYYIHTNYLTTDEPVIEDWVHLGKFKTTAYCGGVCCNGKWAGQTSTGVSPREGRTIAVAPWVIPYGTEVKIDGLDNIYVAEDTGGFANRNDHQIDLFIVDHSRTNNWGVQYRDVWIKR